MYPSTLAPWRKQGRAGMQRAFALPAFVPVRPVSCFHHGILFCYIMTSQSFARQLANRPCRPRMLPSVAYTPSSPLPAEITEKVKILHDIRENMDLVHNDYNSFLAGCFQPLVELLGSVPPVLGLPPDQRLEDALEHRLRKLIIEVRCPPAGCFLHRIARNARLPVCDEWQAMDSLLHPLNLRVLCSALHVCDQ